MRNVSSVALLSAATAQSNGETQLFPKGVSTSFHAYGATTDGAGACVVTIQVSDKATAPVTATDVDWVTLGTITLTLGTTQTGDGFACLTSWRWVRAQVTSISGTGAAVTCLMGA